MVCCLEERFTTCSSPGFRCELCFDANSSNFFCLSLTVRATFSCICSLCSSMVASLCWPIENYNLQYGLNSDCGCYTTVNISSATVTLQDLVPNADYTVEAAAINSNGDMSAFSEVTQFTVTPTTPAPTAV